MNSTRRPTALSSPTASDDPGTATSPRQTTPSRSQHTTGGAPAATTSARGLADLLERVPVLVEWAHRDRELQVTARTVAVPDAQQRETEAEVCVVVHGVDLDRSLELRARRRVPAAPEVRASE